MLDPTFSLLFYFKRRSWQHYFKKLLLKEEKKRTLFESKINVVQIALIIRTREKLS